MQSPTMGKFHLSSYGELAFCWLWQCKDRHKDVCSEIVSIITEKDTVGLLDVVLTGF